jgi:flagellar biosynthesis/type III secretory pathway chaperone
MFSASEFQKLLREQIELLDRLIDIGEQQKQAIETGRMSELIAILGQKQPDLDRLADIQRMFSHHKTDIENADFWPESSQRQLCQGLREQSAAAFEVLIQLEQDGELAVTQSRDQIQLRLQNIESSRAVASAYESLANVPSAPRGDFSSVG